MDAPPARLAAIRPNLRNSVRFGVTVAGGLVLAALSIRPLEDVAADAIMRAPNAGRARPGAPLDGEITVDVGPTSATLSLALVGPAAARGTIFILHGIRDSKESMRGWGEMLAHSGYRAVLVDLRGHGRSTGDVLSYGVRESMDLVQALDALDKRGLVRAPYGVMGISYGAATAIQWAGRDARLRAVVALAPFESLRAVVPGYAPVPLPAAFIDAAIDRAGARGGFDPDAASPLAAIAHTSARVLLVHGRADAQIPPWHSEHIHAAAGSTSELVLIDGAGHESVASDPATNLTARAPAWFDANL